MRVMKVVIIAEKIYISRVSRLFIFLHCRHLHIQHESPKKAFYCLDITQAPDLFKNFSLNEKKNFKEKSLKRHVHVIYETL